MHIGTELQTLKVKMALTCHADYRWICMTSLKETRQIMNGRKLKIIFRVFGTALTLAWT